MLVNTTKYGQLGNRLQLFAHFIAFAIENKQQIVNLGFSEYADLFETTRKDIFCRYPPKRSLLTNDYLRNFLYKAVQWLIKARVIERTDIKYCKIIECYPYSKNNKEYRLDNPKLTKSLTTWQVILAHGYYFVDYVNLLKHAGKIREYFIPCEPHKTNVEKIIAGARSLCDILIGVHLRRGDYKHYRNGEFYFEPDDYINVIKRAASLFPDKKTCFLVCSDEFLDRDRFAGLNVIFGSSHVLEDMYSLAECDYIVGVLSTYSRWACFYGNVPTYHFKDSTKEITLSDFKSFDTIVHEHMQTAPQFPGSFTENYTVPIPEK